MSQNNKFQSKNHILAFVEKINSTQEQQARQNQFYSY